MATENELKLIKSYAKSMGKTWKMMRAEYESAVLAEAIRHRQGKLTQADVVDSLASQLTDEDMSAE
jgi:hypothetical protein